MDLVTAKEIEQSDMFFAIVTKYWIAEPWHKDEVDYARSLGKPFALAIEEGVAPGSLFDGCNIIGKTKFDRDNLNHEQLNNWVKGIRDYLLRTKEE